MEKVEREEEGGMSSAPDGTASGWVSGLERLAQRMDECIGEGGAGLGRRGRWADGQGGAAAGAAG